MRLGIEEYGVTYLHKMGYHRAGQESRSFALV
jgi:hypothetical protein